MNEKLQESLAEIINITLQGKDFILEQAPDVIQQLLAWKFTVSLLLFILILSIIPGAWIGVKKMRSVITPIEVIIIISIVGVIAVVAIPLSYGGYVGPFTWLQILIAPKVYLLEYASYLIS
jgi:hypothetical protein